MLRILDDKMNRGGKGCKYLQKETIWHVEEKKNTEGVVRNIWHLKRSRKQKEREEICWRTKLFGMWRRRKTEKENIWFVKKAKNGEGKGGNSWSGEEKKIGKEKEEMLWRRKSDCRQLYRRTIEGSIRGPKN